MNPYRLLYRLGITPWDRGEVPEPLREFAEERSAAPGRALDLGCGTGLESVYLAKRGWTVTAVDAVPQAMDAARRRGADAGVQVNWVLGDVTRLETLGVGEGYDLFLDGGCFHGLSGDGRERYARGVTAAAAPGARLLLFGFQPRRLGIGPRGLTAAELRRRFPGWELCSSRSSGEKLPLLLGDARPTWHELANRA